jgi:hypothetical protein
MKSRSQPAELLNYDRVIRGQKGTEFEKELVSSNIISV